MLLQRSKKQQNQQKSRVIRTVSCSDEYVYRLLVRTREDDSTQPNQIMLI